MSEKKAIILLVLLVAAAVLVWLQFDNIKKLIGMYPVDTIKQIVKSLRKFGITNPIAQAGILAVVSTEGGFIPKSELSMKNTPTDRVKQIFGSRLKGLTDQQIDNLKQFDDLFYNLVYGNQYGNGSNDGYKYRGRGFNGITFKNSYKKYGERIGVDLVNNPDLLNSIPVAADALASYFADVLNTKYDTSKFTSLNDATALAFHANAGWGTDMTKGVLPAEHKKQLANVTELYDIVKQS